MPEIKNDAKTREKEAREAQCPPEEPLEHTGEQSVNGGEMNQDPSSESTPKGNGEESPEKNEEELLQAQVAELNDRLLRTMAEYDNFRRRSQREKEAIYPQATAAAVGQFVPILDTFDRALEAPCADEAFKQGVEMILTNFREVLTKLGVEAFGASGEAFNPEMHNAVMHVEDEALDAGVIVEVFQKGYKLGDRIIRHAMVKVAN